MRFSKATQCFYPEDIDYPSLPSDLITVTQADYVTAMGRPRGSTLDVVQGAIVIVPLPAPILSEIQFSALSAIDAAAGAARARYITAVAGQAETYLRKEDQARAYKAAGYPSADAASYPLMLAEAHAVSGATPTAAQIQSAADDIIAQADAWIANGAQVEQARRAGKIAVSAAADVAAVDAARDTAIAALAGV